MIYLLVSFGLFALVYVGGFLLSLRRTFSDEPSNGFFGRCVRGWALVVFSYGCTSNMVEQPLMNMVIGLCFGAVTMVFATRETSAVTTVFATREASAFTKASVAREAPAITLNAPQERPT
jgi:hypothetical protein